MSSPEQHAHTFLAVSDKKKGVDACLEVTKQELAQFLSAADNKPCSGPRLWLDLYGRIVVIGKFRELGPPCIRGSEPTNINTQYRNTIQL